MRRCPRGCKGTHISPFDEQLGLVAYQQTSWEVQYLGTLLSLFVPYGLASYLLSQLSGVSISESSLWRWVQQFGQKARHLWDERLNSAEVAPEEMPADIAELMMVIAADGVMVPFRPHALTAKGKTVWREVKVAVVARLEHLKTAAGKLYTRLRQRRLVGVLGNIDALQQRLEWEAQRQGIAQAPQVVWLSDGGVGFWRLFRQCFACCATGILDFYHAASHLCKAAQAYCHQDSEAAKVCFERWRHLLRHGHHAQVLSELTRLVNTVMLPESEMAELMQVQAYFAEHREHIRYGDFETQRFPLGSGMVESACKWLIQQRFKGVGMRWSEPGFENLLYLRLEWVNQRFENLFPEPHLFTKSGPP